jgi:hypothetical protein
MMTAIPNPTEMRDLIMREIADVHDMVGRPHVTNAPPKIEEL